MNMAKLSNNAFLTPSHLCELAELRVKAAVMQTADRNKMVTKGDILAGEMRTNADNLRL